MKTESKTFLNQAKRLIIISSALLVLLALSSLSYKNYPPSKGVHSFDYPDYFGNRINVPLNNPTSEQGVYLGRRLFYEVKLSSNNSMSCGSCHLQAKAFSDHKKFSVGVDKSLTSRNTMALVNLLWNRKFFWDARTGSLEEQASFPMVEPHEMGQSLASSVKKLQATADYPDLFKNAFGDEKVTADRIVKALAQFERTLISANSKYDAYLKQSAKLSEAEMRGLLLFNTLPNPDKGIRGANCAHCHGGKKQYLELFHNNGLDRFYTDAGIGTITGIQTDMGRFKIPTLRNIAITAPYMHDGRFATLEEVVDHYSEHVQQSTALSAFLQNASNHKGSIPLKLSVQEKRDLIAFLHSLTDSTFITNPKFSNPFTKP